MLRRLGAPNTALISAKVCGLAAARQKANMTARGAHRRRAAVSFPDGGDTSPLCFMSVAQAELASLREEYRQTNDEESFECGVQREFPTDQHANDCEFGGASSCMKAVKMGMMMPVGGFLPHGYSSRYPTNASLVSYSRPVATGSMGGLGFLRPSAFLLHRGLTTAERERATTLSKEKKISYEEAKSIVKNEKTSQAPKVGTVIRKRVAESSSDKDLRGGVPADYVTKIKSDVVDDIIHKMTSPTVKTHRQRRALPEESRSEVRVGSYVRSQLARDRLRSHFRIDPNTPIDHLSLPELYEYLFVALKGGEVQQQARRRIPMTMRMACGERSLEVPPPSFIYVLLQSDPNLLHESYHPRVAYAVEQWLKLPEETRKYFVDHPLKGISE